VVVRGDVIVNGGELVVVAVEVELTGDSSTDDDDGGANGRIHE
jgi:hypothetical protein